jgi:hypothetical protein
METKQDIKGASIQQSLTSLSVLIVGFFALVLLAGLALWRANDILATAKWSGLLISGLGFIWCAPALFIIGRIRNRVAALEAAAGFNHHAIN